MARRIHQHAQLNAKELAAFLGFESDWVVRAIKKANWHLHEQGIEPLIFTGRFSTAAKVSRWLDDHPDFVAGQIHRRGVGVISSWADSKPSSVEFPPDQNLAHQCSPANLPAANVGKSC